MSGFSFRAYTKCAKNTLKIELHKKNVIKSKIARIIYHEKN